MSWFVVGGVAIGATAGAIVGSKKGGDDVWKDALIGGAIGGTAGAGAGVGSGAGVFGGIGADAGLAATPALAAESTAIPAISGAEGTAAASTLGGAGSGIMAAPAAAPSASTMAAYGSTAPLGSSVVPSAYGGAGSGLTAGSSAGVPSVASGSSGFMSSSQAVPGFMPGLQQPAIQMITPPAAEAGGIANIPGVSPVQGNFPSSVPGTLQQSVPNATVGGPGIQGTTPTASGGNTSMMQKAMERTASDSPLKKGFGDAMGWLSDPKNAMMTGVLGLGALSMFNKDNENNFDQQTVTQSGYPLSPDFKPTRTDPRQFRYKSSYADGGITSVAGQQNTMYPQSQIPDRTQFAVPSQMPTSMEVVGADYDTLTNPYTGDMPRFASGKLVDSSKYMAMIDPKMKATETHTPDYVGKGGIYYDEDPDTKYQDALTAAQTRMGKAASRANVQLGAMQKPTPMGKLNLGPVVKEKQQAAADDDGLAGGGITSLGGYAHGGNARLLRGPGDGMSDDIPASIGGKQPARLADGEFVVPADVVSGLGNGSTEAGAKKLHQMMDKVRVDRTGTKKQGKQIKADKYVPGLKTKGIAGYAEGGATTTEEPAKTPDTVAIQPASTQPIQAQVPATQYAMGGSQTPDYRMPGSALGSGLGRWNNLANTAAMEARQPSLNQQVTQSYLQNLGRAPDQQGFNYWMDSGLTGQQINKAIQASPESVQIDPTNKANVNAYVESLYQQALGRQADQSGMDYWANQITSGQSNPNDILRGVQGSPEFKVREAYRDLLGRMPDTEGAQYWQQQMGQGMTYDQLRSALQGSTEGQAFATAQKKKADAANPNLVQTQTVQDMIDAALNKYKEENPTYTPPSYNYGDGGGGGGSGGERAGGVIKAKKRKGGILAAKK